LFALGALVLFLAADGADPHDGGPVTVMAGVLVPAAEGELPPPSAYDCRSAPPRRASPVPLECLVRARCATTLVVAHRGAGIDSFAPVPGTYVPVGRFAPENTLSALRWATVVGADMAEVDVRLTRDGVPVLVHDGDVARTTMGRGRVEEMTLADLRSFKLRTAQFAGDFSCERIPTLKEALTQAKGRIGLYLDLKTPHADVVARVVRNTGMLDQVLLFSPDLEVLALARSAVPSIAVMPRARRQAEIAALLADRSARPVAVSFWPGLFSKENMAQVHAAGVKVFADGMYYDVMGYLTNDPVAYAPLKFREPDAIQVDRVDLLLRALGRR
jgi:glycerophosphoryl diester phosphodiesterase